MKKEYFFVFAICLIIFAYIVDSISGPVNLVIKNPYAFLQTDIMAQYPLTAVGIFTRSLGIFIGTIFLLSLFEKIFFIER